MKFDTIRFAIDFNLDWSIDDKDVSDNYVGFPCPFCGKGGYHFGIHKVFGSCSCWVCGQHSLYEAIELLTGIPPKEIIDNYSNILYSNYQDAQKEVQRASKCIVPGKPIQAIHREYLEGRQFDPDYLVYKYKITGTVLERPSFRVVFPITVNNRVVSWQGRTIGNDKRKYIFPKPEEEVIPNSQILFNLDNCYKDTVLVVEGVFDTLRFGDNCVATFGSGVTEAQLYILMNNFKKVFFLFDNDEEAQKKAKKYLTILNNCGIITENLCLEGEGDPGDLKEDDAIAIKKEINLI